MTPLILLHLYPRALLQLTLQTVSAPSTAFSVPTSTDPALNGAASPLSGSSSGIKGKARARPRGVATGAGERAATINAAMMAFVDAGVQCRGMLVAVAVARLPRRTPSDTANEDEEEMVLDPSPEEEDSATSTHVFAFSFGVGVGGTEGTCVSIDSVGTFSEDQVRVSPWDRLGLPSLQATSTLTASSRRDVCHDHATAHSSLTRKTSHNPPPKPFSHLSGKASRQSTASSQARHRP